DLYSFNVIPALGRVVAGDAEAYRYLVESIRRFPHPQAFAEMMRSAGFGRVRFERMAGGVVALHSGWRLCAKPSGAPFCALSPCGRGQRWTSNKHGWVRGTEH